MTALLSTTLIAVAAICAATVSVCLHVIDQQTWVSIVAGFGGGTGVVHAVAGSSRAGSGSLGGGG